MAEFKCHQLKVRGIQAQLVDNPMDQEEESCEEVFKTKKLFDDYFLPFFNSMGVGLYCVLHIFRIAKALNSTSRSDNPLRAFVRYYDTLLHVIRWFESPSSRNSSLRTIRILHRNA